MPGTVRPIRAALRESGAGRRGSVDSRGRGERGGAKTGLGTEAFRIKVGRETSASAFEALAGGQIDVVGGLQKQNQKEEGDEEEDRVKTSGIDLNSSLRLPRHGNKS